MQDPDRHSCDLSHRLQKRPIHWHLTHGHNGYHRVEPSIIARMVLQRLKNHLLLALILQYGMKMCLRSHRPSWLVRHGSVESSAPAVVKATWTICELHKAVCAALQRLRQSDQ
eukprot:2385670-Rhodomonas_salina.2